MDERYGAINGALLRAMIADIRAARSLREVPLLVLCPIDSGLRDEAAIKLGADLVIVIRANLRKPPRLEEGDMDWPRVDRVLIQRIEQAHG